MKRRLTVPRACVSAASLAAARIDVDAEEIVAGRPTGLEVLVTPNAARLSLPLADLLAGRAREPRGPHLALPPAPLVLPSLVAVVGVGVILAGFRGESR